MNAEPHFLVPPAEGLPPTVHRMAECATAFEARMATLPADIDPSWQREFVDRSPVLSLYASMTPTPEVGLASVLQTVLRRFCGDVPSLHRLAAEPARIALQARPMVLRALCLLAVSRRPGVLRCCIDRSHKELLEQSLGDALGAVEALATRGRPVSHEVTTWTPLHWSCVGYLDWTRLLTREDTFLRRLVRVMLPHGLLDMPKRAHLARSDFPARDALMRLGAAGVQWPC